MGCKRLDFKTLGSLNFESPDTDRFPNLRLAYEAIERGGNAPCALNAANEVANLAFRKNQCSFLGMAEIIEQTMQKTAFDKNPDLDVYLQTDKEARRIASELVAQNS